MARLYHSNTILLPDATVLSLGGGAPGPLTNLNGEIYTPGYLFDANGAPAVRPIIEQAPTDLNPGQTFTVRVDNPANIRTLALMPFGSSTHSFNMEARRIELSFSVQADGSLSVTWPTNSSDVVPPGDWMLFAIDENGTPSIASTINVHTNDPYYLPALSLSSIITTDTGSTATITSGGITNDNTLALSGTVNATGVSSVKVYDGTTLLGTATVSSGNWNYTTAALPDGIHSFTASFTDGAGNTTTTSPTAVTAMVDTTAAIETISSTIGTNTGSTTTITSGGTTNDNTLALSGTVSDANGVSSVQIYDGTTLLGPATVSSGNWTYTTIALRNGGHSFTAIATDNAGNITTSSAVTATVNTGVVDTTPPSETISSTIGTDTGSTATITSGGLTKDNTLALSGTVSDASGINSVQIYDGPTLLGVATVSSANWNYTTVALLDGSHTFTAQAIDNAGNITTTPAVTATVDTTAPSVTRSNIIGTDTGSTTTIDERRLDQGQHSGAVGHGQ